MPYAGTLYRDYFKDNLADDVGVSNDVPSIRAKRQVAVLTVPAGGHAKPEQFRWQRIIVQIWAQGNAEMDADAAGAELGNDVRTLVLRSKRELATVHKIVLVGDLGRFDDPDDTSPRFQMTFDALFKQTVPVTSPAAT
jgi:hypothetical protein